jgi:hypothetical protein
MKSKIYWTSVRTADNYPFYAWRSNKGRGNIIIITEHPNLDTTKRKSLTNNIEEVLEHFIRVLVFSDEIANIKWYQWVRNEGLFELSFKYSPARDYEVGDVTWKFIGDNLETFEVLYVS